MPRFLQIHTLTSYPASLLNRDDVGFAKRLPFGGSDRVRISSQCLKRHWRTADHEHALDRVRQDDAELAVRSRRTFELHLYEPLLADGIAEDVAQAVTEEVVKTVLPESKRKQATKTEGGEPDRASALRTSQVTVIGRPEIRYLLELARGAAQGAEDADEARKSWQANDEGELRKNLQALTRGAGLDAALFGRMVTGDVLARCDAAIHVAHAFTVHPGFFETDYFSAVDDLNPQGETGSGHINTSELTSGLYYGYVVLDVPLLISNLEGCPREDWQSADRSLAGEVASRLVYLIATVSPGAKLGSTAPYAHALSMLVEDGSSQPRSLANAYLDPVRQNGSLLLGAQERLAAHLQALDDMYGRTTERRWAAIDAPDSLAEAAGDRLTLPALSEWVAERVREAQ